MNPNYQTLIDLTKCALKQTKYHGDVSYDIFVIARENGISGTIFKALDKNVVKESVYKQFQEEYYQYIKKDQMQVSVLAELRQIFDMEGIDYIFLKGSFLKTIYPESYMRSMGDIDVLIKPEQMKDIHVIMEKNGFEQWVTSDHHDCFLKYKDVNVEIHPKLFSSLKGSNKTFFENPWRHSIPISKHEYHFNVEYNFLYQIYHMIKHMYSSGVGFRTIIDLYIYLERYEKVFITSILNEYLDDFEHKTYVYNLVKFINELFSETLLFDVAENGKISKIDIEKLTSFLFVSGIHGIGKGHNLFVGGFAKLNHQHKNVIISKIKYMFAKTFLPYQEMKALYPFIRKYKFLLPVAWLCRIFNLTFKKRSRTIRKLKRLSISKEEVLEVENLFNHIGI